ncbi:hypothetical protein LPJ59_000603 [Coemansia sp. RSA 2399]|nr:hypothetical protein LPJ59_000603 [Coemansia sp. RSA 2399]KAJ1908367.1 hypothetical protein LPJ81_000158 [Coemansia sp. IMI 209127]
MASHTTRLRPKAGDAFQQAHTCSKSHSADCHMRSDGIIIVDPSDNIIFADTDAIGALRGPVDDWIDGQLVPLRDDSCTGRLADYWRLLESLSVSDKAGYGDTHHYLVVERKEDAAVCWIQFCIHYSPAEDGRPLYVWNVRDITNSARCLDMLRTSTSASSDYMLSLEDDGFPHSPLLTQVQSAGSGLSPAPTDMESRDSLFQLLETAASTGAFGVIHLTEFGAVDSAFPRSFLGWQEEDILDRSFVGLLSPDDRVFFCQALRRCSHDGLPQRLILKVADAFQKRHLDCDVTVLMPDDVHHPVLVVKAIDLPQRKMQQQQQQQHCGDDAAVSVVRRMRLDGSASSFSSSSSYTPPPPLADGNLGGRPPVRAGTPFVFASPLSCSLSRSISSPSFGVVPAISDERQTRSINISDVDADDDEDEFGLVNGRSRFAYMPPTPPKKRAAETPQSLLQHSFGTQRLSNMMASTLALSRFDDDDDDDGALSFSCGSECSCSCKHNSMPLSICPAADVGVVDIAALSGGDTQDLGEAKTVIPPSALLPNLRDGTKQATRSSSSDSTSTHIDNLALAPRTGKMAFRILCGMTEETAPLASSKGAKSAKESVSRNSMLSLVSDQELARVSIPMSKIFACAAAMPAVSHGSSIGLCDSMKETAHGSFSLTGKSFISMLEDMNTGTT